MVYIYEYIIQVGMVIKNDVVQFIFKQQFVQMFFCFKEKNQKKINFYCWFFDVFGKVLDFNICVLIDVGIKFGGSLIYQFWKVFDFEFMCGGVCGEIKVMLGGFY